MPMTGIDYPINLFAPCGSVVLLVQTFELFSIMK